MGYLFTFIIVLLLLVLLKVTVNVVPQQYAYVIERLGKFHTVWEAGLRFRIPLIDHIAKKVLLKEQVADFAPQPVITKDNVTMQIDSVVYFKIFDPELYAYGVQNPIMAMENLTATTLRNIIGDMDLDETLTSRETINSQMLNTIDSATDPWGIKVTRVELKNIQPPAAIREAMEKQMKAEREKRAAILTAEGEKQSMILEAQGKKESAVLAAEATKEKEIKEAEGKAEAIRQVQQATADGLKAIKEAGADEAVLKLKSLEAFAQAADGQATKIIVPSDIAGIAGIVEALKDTTVSTKESKKK